VIDADHIGPKAPVSVERIDVYGSTKPTWLSTSLQWRNSRNPVKDGQKWFTLAAAECGGIGFFLREADTTMKGHHWR
jgi:hypothetical protein